MRTPLLSVLAFAAALLARPVAAADTATVSPEGYPTADRVTYVQACMRQHPGAAFEMLSKCSCTLDAIARELSYDDFTTLSTIANAMSIGGAYVHLYGNADVRVRRKMGHVTALGASPEDALETARLAASMVRL